jgi:hypothetical protein
VAHFTGWPKLNIKSLVLAVSITIKKPIENIIEIYRRSTPSTSGCKGGVRGLRVKV